MLEDYSTNFKNTECFIPGTIKSFNQGSLIIPMDDNYQDMGIFKAYGLVYQLIKNNITVYWAIKSGKAVNGSGFTASSIDYNSSNPISSYAYKGGPFIIDESDVEKAATIIDNRQLTNNTTVHKVVDNFKAPIARFLNVLPKIAVFEDGNEDIAFEYLNEVGIPDSNGNSWVLTSFCCCCGSKLYQS